MAVNRIWLLPAPAGALTKAALTLILIGYGGIPLAPPMPDAWVAQCSVSDIWKEQNSVSNTWVKQNE